MISALVGERRKRRPLAETGRREHVDPHRGDHAGIALAAPTARKSSSDVSRRGPSARRVDPVMQCSAGQFELVRHLGGDELGV